MERDKRILRFLALTGGATARQVRRHIDSSTRYTNYILKRLARDSLVYPIGRLITSTGGRPQTVWSVKKSALDRPPENSVLLSEYLSGRVGDSFCPLRPGGIAAFESARSKWRLPESVDAFVCASRPVKVAIPVSSEHSAKELIVEQASALRWSLLPHYELTLLAPESLCDLIHNYQDQQASHRFFDAECLFVEIHRIALLDHPALRRETADVD